jgi:heme/copper-type cytochrome/quinol oxidase subunit 2
MLGQDDKRRPPALNLTPKRSASSDSSSSDNSLKPRTPRFAEATSIHSPIEGNRSPFADPEPSKAPQPADVGLGYINKRESVTVPMALKSPLKSAMKVPGTPGRRFENPLSPTFRPEDVLEKREAHTDKEQARDLKIKARVRLAKVALRGVNFSCALIILSMLSASFAIFNATKLLPDQSDKPAWAKDTNTWPQKLVLAMACVSLLACLMVFFAYCRGGHRRAEKVSTYYTMFAIGWFILSMILWAVTAALFQHSRNNSNNTDMWGWSCVENNRATIYGDKVDYQLICRLQNWTMICIIIEIVIEVICIVLYSVVFYRYYTKRRLTKSMDMRDRARSDLYLAQLRSQSAPNTPGFGPKSPALSQFAMSPRQPPASFRNLADIEESPFTPGGKLHEPVSSFSPSTQEGFKLQAPPKKAPSAKPKAEQASFTPGPLPTVAPQETTQQHAPIADDEPTYDAVPIPGAYAGAAIKSPPPTQVSFGQAR